MKKALFLLAVTGISFYLTSQNSAPTAQWIRSYNGQTEGGSLTVKSVKDAGGNYYVLSSDNYDVFISKFDNAGSLLADYTYNEPTNGANYSADIEVDLQGNIYHCGRAFIVPQWQQYPIIVKMSPTGAVLWETKPACVYYTNSTNFAMTVDNVNGNVFYCGANSDTFSVGKLNSAGTILWNKNIALSGYGAGEAHDIQIDQFGNSYVTGKMKNTGTNNYDVVTLKLDASGNIIWQKILNGLTNGDDDGLILKTDNSANAYVAGKLTDSSATNTNTFLVKYNASGGQQWIKKYYKSASNYSQPGDVLVDASGSVYVAANYYGPGTAGSSEIFRYTNSGTLVYSVAYTDPTYLNAEVNSIKSDALGNCYVGGTKLSATTSADIFVAKFNLGGTFQWDAEYNVGSVSDYGKTIHLDNGNNVIVCGTSSGSGATSNPAAIKYTSAGVPVWSAFSSRLGNPYDEYKEVITQGNYSIYTVGTTENSFSHYDILVSKYDNEGNILWQNVQDFGATDNSADDMVADANFNISVLGQQQYAQSVVIKYDSIGTPNSTTTLQNGVWYKKIVLDNAGNYLLAGDASGGGSSTFCVAKLNSSNNITFQNPVAVNAAYQTDVASLDTDPAGRFYVAGLSGQNLNSGYRKFTVQRFSPAGNLLWSRLIGGLDSVQTGGYDFYYWKMKKIIVDQTANTSFVLMTARVTGQTNACALLVKLDANGNELWRVAMNNADQNYEIAIDMVSSSANSIVILSGVNYGQYARLHRIDKTSGAVTATQDIFGTNGSQISPAALKEQNGSGYLYITGRSFKNFLIYVDVIKTNAAFQTQWGSLTPGALIGENMPMSIDVTGNDRIYVAGQMTMTNGPSMDAALLKLCDINANALNATGSLQNICPGNSVTLDAGSASAYNWNVAGNTQQTFNADSTGAYFCTTYKQDGCWKNTDTLFVTIKNPPSAPSICVVTVDTTSDYNIVYWDPNSISGADSVRIYREDVTNVYSYIGSVSADSNGIYHDTVADPNVTTKRYKISAIDSCGNESALSGYHNTIYIVDNGGGQYSWNPLYTIENSANPVNNYVLMRDDFSTGNWQQVSITAGTQSTIVDPNYSSYPNARWRVETVWNISCDPDRAIVNTSRSNIKNQLAGPTTGIEEQSFITASFAPNPFNNSTQIDIRTTNGKVNVVFELFDETGRLIKAENINTNKFILERGNLANGIYFYRISERTSGAKQQGKLIVND